VHLGHAWGHGHGLNTGAVEGEESQGGFVDLSSVEKTTAGEHNTYLFRHYFILVVKAAPGRTSQETLKGQIAAVMKRRKG